MEESYPHPPHGESKASSRRSARSRGRGKRAEMEAYFFGHQWTVGESPSPFARRSDPGDHEPLFFMERSGEARRGVWGQLRFEPSHRPLWLGEDEPVRVFLPALYPVDLPGEPIASVELDGKRYRSVAAGARGVRFAFDPVFAVDCHLAEVHCSFEKARASSLAWHVKWVPPGLKRALERRASKRRGDPTPPPGSDEWLTAKGPEALDWLIREALRAAGVRGGSGPLPSWPGGKTHAVCLTHELPGPVRPRWVEAIKALEEGRGLRSTWFVPGDKGLGGPADPLDRLRSDGHEVGLLGDLSGTALAFRSDIAVRRHLDRLRPFMERRDVRGFRSFVRMSSPLSRTLLGELGLYDSSVPDIDLFDPVAPGRGCNSVHPYRLNGTVEIPITLPTSDRLEGIGLTPAEMAAQWAEKLDWIRSVRGGRDLQLPLQRRFPRPGRLLGPLTAALPL